MKCTVITICRNSTATIERTIRSVLSQTRCPEEYLFVDGDSTDGTPELVQRFFPELRNAGIQPIFLKQEFHSGEAGIPSAWNQGIRKASGDAIALLNSDDFYAPNAIQNALDLLERHPHCGVAALPIQWLTPEGEKVGVFFPRSLQWIQWRMPVPHPGCFIRKSVYDTIGLYNTKYRISADYDYIYRCKNAGIRFCTGEHPAVFMTTGGLANSSRALARGETLEIARCHSPFPLLAWGAYFLRKLTGR